MRRKPRRMLLVFAAAVLVAAAVYCIELAIPKRAFFIDRAGTLVGQAQTQTRHARTTSETVHLVSSSGLEVDMRVSRPAYDGERKLPVLLVLGGYRTGKDAVDLVGEPKHIAYAAIDYPYDGKQDLGDFWTSVAAIPGIQDAFLDSPPALLLALEWLLEQPWVDTKRVELAGISLGVPFAAPAGALDARFSRVWLMHGGGDNVSWVSGQARHRIENEALRRITVRLILFAVYGNSFNTERWIEEIAPRPLVIVVAHDDDFVSAAAREPMLEAARAPHVELIWTQGKHIGPRRRDELGQLLAIVRARISSVPN